MSSRSGDCIGDECLEAGGEQEGDEKGDEGPHEWYVSSGGIEPEVDGGSLSIEGESGSWSG